MDIDTKNLFKIKGKTAPDKINKNYILKNIDKFDLNQVNIYNNNILMYIINFNYDFKLNFNKKEILSILDKFDLNQVDSLGRNILQIIIQNNKYQNLGFNKEDILNFLYKFNLNSVDFNGMNALMYIILYNKENNLGFNQDDILNILDKFDLTQQNKYGLNILMFIIYYNKISNLGLNQEDILSILDKFDLNQKSIFGKSVYDYIIQEKFIIDDAFLSFLIAKLNIETVDENNKNILIKGLKRGLCFDSEELVQKLLNTNNKRIINCVYNHIKQIKWKQEELLIFLNKNNLKLKEDIVNII